MPGSFLLSEDSNSISFSSAVTISSLNRDGGRSAFTPYKPTTVLTNLQRGNVQTHTPSVLPERSVHQLAAQGELFLQDIENFDADKRDQNGLTPLMWASSFGQFETVHELINRGASVCAVGALGENALILASSAGHSTIVKELISHGASLDCKDEEGNTALMYAAFNDHAGCVLELLTAGADVTLLNEALESAYEIAVKRRSKHTQAVMERHILNLMSEENVQG